ncbi:alpha beta-hydrolase [Coniophora puteana RWD-64-598 SS2]|uniref:Carboxylic ester hydrolase n=1 Tax=Coniophora puteana (strain RWD-64-598) TaxID=741705 RepID=A0A5M3MYB1_CONPW|nr:alpha beta-hydrolase [Coniophora puteana RWD-64-598 SS2]EIW83611.1 alpha beta-hydrolase [Coniophora puteana RWD-64-598 SS2]
MLLRCVLALLSLAVVALGQSQSPAIDLGYATYEGTTNTTTGVTSFYGIRYAAPPTGEFRFGAPQPPAHVSGIQQATNEPNSCYQATNGHMPSSPYARSQGSTSALGKRAEPVYSEDCLFLNVFTPVNLSTTATSGLPVVVFIHGGGYTVCSYVAGSVYTQHGENLVADADNDVVMVGIQYRLGIFGFLSGNEVVEGGGALNAGLLDQTFALQWVQDHISKFGGDASKVTIWGQSAGAGSVFQHIIANGGNTQPPLFRAAMTSSTFFPSQYWYNGTIPETVYQAIVNGTGCSTSVSSFACLRSASVDILEQLNNQTNNDAFYGVYTTVPVVDGKLIVEPPIETLAKGHVNGEVLLSVTNSDEGALFVNADVPFDPVYYIHNLFPQLPADDVQKVADAYETYTIPAGRGVPEGRDVTQAIGIMGESIFYCATYFLLEGFSKAGKNAWKGFFGIPPGYHAEDVPYYFTSSVRFFDGPPIDNPSFTASFAQSFMSVVINLDPNDHINSSDVTPQWKTWAQANTEMLFNVTETNLTDIHAITTDPGMLARCE